MQRAVKILSAFFATAAVLAFGALVILAAWFVRDARSGHLPLDNPHVLTSSLMFTFLLASTGIYAGISRALWLRQKWGTTVFFSALVILFFPVGPVLGISALILLTRPAIRATFTS